MPKALLLLCLLAPLYARAEPPASPAPTSPLKGYAHAKVLVGAAGERVTIVYLEPREKNQVLLKFENVRGAWDGKVVLHELQLNGDKEDYFARSEKLYVSLVLRGGAWEATPMGGQELKLKYSDDESKAVKVEAIVAEYEKAPTELYKKKQR